MADDRVRFGFLGAGWIAHRALAPAVQAADGAVLQAVAARDADRAGRLEPVGRVSTDYRAVLDDPEVEVVYISLHNDGHRPWALAALEAGKHVLCEKPLGLDATEVREMLAAARAAGRLLVEAFWYRWHPRTRRLERLLQDGACGPVGMMQAEFSFDGGTDPRMVGNYRLSPEHGGGALYDVGCYPLSAAHLVLGAEQTVERARADLGPTGVDLATTAWLTVPGTGTRAEIRCGIAIPDRQQLTITGETATVDFAAGEAFTNWHAPSSLTITTADGTVRTEDFAPVDPYRLMVEAVAARVRGRDAFLVEPDHSLQVATTLDAVRAALP